MSFEITYNNCVQFQVINSPKVQQVSKSEANEDVKAAPTPRAQQVTKSEASEDVKTAPTASDSEKSDDENDPDTSFESIPRRC